MAHRVPEQRVVKEGRQWRPFASRRHVAAAEVGDRVDPCDLGDAVGVADLHGERRFGFGVVADGLAVGTDGAHGLGRNAELGEEPKHRLADELAQGRVGDANAKDLVRPRGSQSPQVAGERLGKRLHRPGGNRDRIVRHLHQREVQAIDAGAGNGAYILGQSSPKADASCGLVSSGARRLAKSGAVTRRKSGLSSSGMGSDLGSSTATGSRWTPSTTNS